MPRPNFYSGVGLDRADNLRIDESWFAARLSDPQTRVVPVWRARNLVTAQTTVAAVWIEGEGAQALVQQGSHATFLGLQSERAYFALDISKHDEPQTLAELNGRGVFRDLRAVGPLISEAEGAVLAYARGLIHWHRRHLFCGRCGTRTVSRRGGHLRHCLNPDCGLDHFPRTDPAVIMLIHAGDKCLLGRQHDWDPGTHSTLAGFVEPGESLEEAVAREVKEEVGISLDVAKIHYHSSQPWPFPSSIMLGFHAECDHQPLEINTDELESATWFDRDLLQNSPEDETFRLPREVSIARRLIEDWLAGG